MASKRRQERIEDLLLEVISEVFRRLKDPGIPSDGLVSFLRVSIGADLGHATVYYSFLGDQAHSKELQAALDRSAGFFRREINKVVRLRKIPDLKFISDASLEKGAEVLTLLEQVRRMDEAARVDESPQE